MLNFFLLFIQVIGIIIGIHTLAEVKLGIKSFFIMLLIAQGIGYPLFYLIGTLGIFLMITLLVGCLVFKTKKVLVNVTIVLTTLIIAIISDYIAQILVIYLLNQHLIIEKNTLMIEIVLAAILTIIFCFLMRMLFDKLNIYEILGNVHGKLIVGFITCTFAIFYADIFIGQYLGFTSQMILFRGILFLFYIALLIVLFFTFSRILTKEMKVETEKIKMESEKVQTEQLVEYTERIEEFYEEMRNFRHDYRNILLGLAEFVRDNDIEGLKEYYSKNIDTIKNEMKFNNYQLGQLTNLRIREIKGIVSSKLIKAQELKINAKIAVPIPIENISMNMVDTCRILGILLDNAIEEAIEVKEGKLDIVFIKEGEYLSIIISNSCRENLPLQSQMFKRGFSTKGNGRGLGLSNLEDIVGRTMNSQLETDIGNGMFTQTLKILVGR